MATTALEKIQAIQAKAEEEIAKLKAEAVSELAKKISEAKAVLSALEYEYEALTGKTLKGDKAGGEGKRVRLTNDEKEALKVTVAEILKAATDGIKFGDIASQAGAPVSAIRNTLKEIKGIKTTGKKAGTLYFLK